ncbi:hypothetical protein GIB67_032918 [Kingdonia uniflora]|uniref:RNase H type-1 domain-containing protein n=1 Tax=Kingdonia uniflora TaxID=39325 RepID=A0A7J7MYE8_9MAGN|nr:hypothetical protein GIB67_032918 [Kingdonia uniflora]
MIFHSLQVPLKHRRAPRIRSCIWELPWFEETKINCDGSCLGNPGIAGGGAVFRTYTGSFLGVLVENIGLNTSYFAECSIIVSALNKSYEKGWLKIFLVSASTAAITAFKNNKVLGGFSPGGSISLQNYRSDLNIHGERATLALMTVLTGLLGFLCCLRNGLREGLHF